MARTLASAAFEAINRSSNRAARLKASACLLALFLTSPALAQPPSATAPTPPAAASPPAGAPRAAPTPEQRAAAAAKLALDWPQLAFYREANAALPAPAAGQKRMVLLGDSITEFWPRRSPGFFETTGYIGRGIGGQTSPQMVVRFHQDVIALKPAVTLILAGTNDVAENTGPATDEQIIDNLTAMVEMAQANKVRVVIGSVPPATRFYWKPELQPAQRIAALNTKIKAWAQSRGLVYADFWSVLAMPDGTMNPDYAGDSVHPNPKGYAVMEPVAKAAIDKALSAPR